ncbi:MAG TPA: SRPBCC family protein [Pseudonocardia sp.]|jgi:phenylpropionate dioxygenase-like ring-hydroxylating dioxygenase large terminal subunit|nr:SRPBCC family protein [Pseudonocardia sp.]
MTTTNPDIDSRRWTPDFDLGTGPVRITGMTDPAYYQREIELLWKRTWHCIGKTHYIPERGDFFVKDLPFANTSILVTRGKDGRIRAFHNVCAHRCNKLMWENTGNSRLLRCRFHGWVYGLDGSVQVVTDESNFFDLDKENLGLRPVSADTMGDFILINLDPEPAETVREYFGDVYHTWDALKDYYGVCTQEYTWIGQFNCNWKILRDAFQEIYHIATLHGSSAAPTFVGPDRPFPRAFDLRLPKYHGQFSVNGTANPQFRPLEALSFKLGGESTGRGGRAGGELPAELNWTDADPSHWYGDFHWMFPGFGIIAYTGFYVQNNYWPVAHDKCIYESRLCMPKPTNVIERWTQENARIQLIATLLEDVRTIEYTQDVINSGAHTHYQLQDAEIGVRHNHHWVQQFAGPYPA